jgi:predicted SnoaL-like aldol condensation-catalyzing enzyme
VRDKDLVFTIRNGGGNSIAADIWRVVDSKIVEHWDVIPARPAQ